MRVLMGSFGRALAYSLYPRVIALSFLPLVLMIALAFALGYFFWDAAVTGFMTWLEQWQLFAVALAWLESVGLGGLRSVLAPLVVLALSTPVIVVLSLLLVALLMTPAMVDLVAQRRFATMERKRGGTFVASLGWSLWSSLLALLALLVSMPFWLVPPLALVVPPLIWGWLSYRVYAFDALAEHASAEERQQLLQRHRHGLLVMGVVTGYLGAAPSLLWASGAMFIALAPLLVPLAIWIYAWVFAFSSLWFTHFLLEALQGMRRSSAVPVTPSPEAACVPVPSAPAATSSPDVIDVPARTLP